MQVVRGLGATPGSVADGCVTREQPTLRWGIAGPTAGEYRVRRRSRMALAGKRPQGRVAGGARGLSASWRGNGSPRRRRVAGLRGWPATLGLRYGPDSYGRQQWGILRNGRKADAATPRVG